MQKDLDFLFEIGSLFNVQRGWRQHLGMDCATVPEHSFRVAFLALMIAKMEGVVGSDEKILKMALVYDVAEARVSDLSYVQKTYVTANEEAAADDALNGSSFEGLREVVREYEAHESIESKIVKDADNLDVDVELREFAERGSTLPEKWKWNREFVRNNKLSTESAKKLWDEIQVADPSNWHMQSNKWKKQMDGMNSTK